MEALRLIDGWDAGTAAAGVARADGVVAKHGAVDVELRWASVTKLFTGVALLVALEEGTVDLDAGGAWLEVRRAGDDVGFRALDPATHAFRAAIAGSEPLGDAADAALGVDPRFDLAAALHALLDDGVVIGLSVNGLPKKES